MFFKYKLKDCPSNMKHKTRSINKVILYMDRWIIQNKPIDFGVFTYLIDEAIKDDNTPFDKAEMYQPKINKAKRIANMRRASIHSKEDTNIIDIYKSTKAKLIEYLLSISSEYTKSALTTMKKADIIRLIEEVNNA